MVDSVPPSLSLYGLPTLQHNLDERALRISGLRFVPVLTVVRQDSLDVSA